MRNLTSIVAVNQDGVIGAGNSLPWRIRTDLRFFREQTRSNVVIMGRKTFDSLGGPLKDRLNIVVTHGFGLFAQAKDCLVAHSIEEAVVLAETKKTRGQEVFVIGGATMYEQFAPFVDRYLITDVYKTVPDGDTFFSNSIFGAVSDWNYRPILAGEPNSDGDEVAFRIFEMTSKFSEKFALNRDRLVQAVSDRSLNRVHRFHRNSGLEGARATA